MINPVACRFNKGSDFFFRLYFTCALLNPTLNADYVTRRRMEDVAMVDSSSESEAEDDGVNRTEQMRLLFAGSATGATEEQLKYDETFTTTAVQPHLDGGSDIDPTDSAVIADEADSAVASAVNGSSGAGAAVEVDESLIFSDERLSETIPKRAAELADEAKRKRQRMTPSPVVVVSNHTMFLVVLFIL